MQWDDLRVILAVSRERTLSGAAKVLGVTHSTVSRRLSALEDAVGARLFERRPEGYVPSAAGATMLESAARVEEEVQSLDRRVLGQDARLSGSLRVTTVDVLAVSFARSIRSFAERFPGVALELSVDNEPRSLSRREADVAMRMTNEPSEHLVGRKLVRIEFALYAERSLVPAGGLTDLESAPWISWDDRVGARVTEQWMQRHAPRPIREITVDNAIVMLESVRNGLGIAFLPCFLGDGDERLLRLRPVEAGFGMDLWILTHPDLRNTARVRAFMDHMHSELRPQQERFSGLV